MINVLKATGKKELFNEEKLRSSIKRAGVPESLDEKVVDHIKSKLYDGITTREIYKHITEFLSNSQNPYTRAKYSLKQAIMDLGPTGYPFEDYVSEILKMEGYQTQLRQILMGKCINHEIDIVAEKDNVRSMVECKFHNMPGIHSQVHVSLYTKARFDDIKEKNNINDAWLITNTKVTPDALNYAICSGIKVLSWDYPEKGSFRDLIEKYKLHPITMLTSITQNQKQLLAGAHIVLAKDVCKNPASLDILGLPNDKKDSILSEC
ncbi:MAG: ATP cone domain-containing protein, partial [Candidatus Parcubacteria bacterium]|nr:ATP cone domain-containing protein [Candidatus Parcubacteria bacterium]